MCKSASWSQNLDLRAYIYEPLHTSIYLACSYQNLVIQKQDGKMSVL